MSSDAAASSSAANDADLPTVQDLNLTADARAGTDLVAAAQAFVPDDDEGGDVDDGDAYNGDLPDFSDDEQKAAPSTSIATRAPKPKGPPGRKKIPVSLKKKVASAVKPTAKPTPKDANVQEVQTAPGGVKLSDTQLDAAIAQLVEANPDVAGKWTREQLQSMIHEAGISKKFLQGKEGLGGKNQKDMASHKFWSTQPVTKLGTPVDEIREGPLEPNKPVEEIRQNPIDLHKDFKWVTVDLSADSERKELYDLLTNHYVEDADASFRFDYSADFIEWALKPPGYVPDWHLGIRVADTNKLVAFISCIPVDLRVRGVTKHCGEVNFMCVHKKLRSKRLAPLLIQEITRQAHLKGVFQAIYTSGAYLPTPVARCQYYHRNLNPSKLVKTGFSAVARNSSMARMISHYKMSDQTSLPGLREIKKGDLKQAARLLRQYLARFDMAPQLNNKEVEHALWSGRGREGENGQRVGQVVWTYVVEDPQHPGRITDLFSFYSLPSTATKVQPKTLINAAYLFYYATTACPSCADLGDGSVAVPVTNWAEELPEQRQALKDRLNLLIGDALVLAQKLGFDVLNALTLQDNDLFLEQQKFGRGDGYLHYYLYNYAVKGEIVGGIDLPQDKGSGVGVVML